MTQKRYSIQLSSASKRELKNFDPHIGKKVYAEIQKLADNPRPHGYEPLTGLDKVYRWEIGPKKNYRVVYKIEDDRLLVLVLHVGDRKEIYRIVDEMK